MLAKIDQYVAYTGEDWRDDNNNDDDVHNSRSDKMLQNLDLINEDDCPELEDVEVPKGRNSYNVRKIVCIFCI